MKPTIALNDKERFPLINDLSFLLQLKQDETVPYFNFQSGDRLNSTHLENVKNYSTYIRSQKTFWEAGKHPAWLEGYIDHCKNKVPFYKSRAGSFAAQPTISRANIKSTPWHFVSDDCNLDDLLVYQTSGTTGAAMDVLFDPVSQACWLPQLQSVLDIYNIEITSDPKKVAIALICAQSSTLTYASLSTYLNGAGILKINLDPADWKHPDQRNTYLEQYNPEILTGDPFAFLSLLELNPVLQPKAIVSSAMKLSEGLRKQLEDKFGCLVLDIYSLTECRMVAFAENNRHRAIRPDLYLEVFDKDLDVEMPLGQRGELVITGGNNPFLPMIRYRTGDYCSLQIEDGIPYLIGLEARKPVVFYDQDNHMVNNIEISRAMTQFPLAGFSLHQEQNKSLLFMAWCNVPLSEQAINTELIKIFGSLIPIEVNIEKLERNISKPVTYSSAFDSL